MIRNWLEVIFSGIFCTLIIFCNFVESSSIGCRYAVSIAEQPTEIYIRTPDKPTIANNEMHLDYLQRLKGNVIASITNAFIPLLRKINKTTDAEEFLRELQAQAKLLMNGYGGYHSGEYDIRSSISTNPISLEDNAKNANFIWDLTYADPDYKLIHLAWNKSIGIDIPGRENGISHNLQDSEKHKITIPGVDEVDAPWNKHNNFRESKSPDFAGDHVIRHAYIPYDAIKKKYAKLMLQLLKELASMVDNGAIRASNDTEKIFIDKLSHYYQLSINTHLFRRGNNSLFMSHVNFFLIEAGFKGIPHLYLDYIANLYNYKDFSKIFLDTVIFYANK